MTFDYNFLNTQFPCNLCTLTHLTNITGNSNTVLWPGRSVGIATGWTVRGSNPGGARFSAVQTGPGAHPASCTMGTGSFPGVESGRGVSSIEVQKQSTAIPLLSPRAFVASKKCETYLPFLPKWK